MLLHGEAVGQSGIERSGDEAGGLHFRERLIIEINFFADRKAKFDFELVERVAVAGHGIHVIVARGQLGLPGLVHVGGLVAILARLEPLRGTDAPQIVGVAVANHVLLLQQREIVVHDLQRELVLKKRVVADAIHHVALGLGQIFHLRAVAAKPAQERLREIHRNDGQNLAARVAGEIAQDIIRQRHAQGSAGFEQFADPHVGIEPAQSFTARHPLKAGFAAGKKLGTKCVTTSRQRKSRQVKALLLRLVAAAVVNGEIERALDGQRAAVGLEAILDQFGGKNFRGLPRGIGGVDVQRVGLPKNLPFRLLHDAIDLLVGRAAVMGRGATGPGEGAEQQRGEPFRKMGRAFRHCFRR